MPISKSYASACKNPIIPPIPGSNNSIGASSSANNSRKFFSGNLSTPTVEKVWKQKSSSREYSEQGTQTGVRPLLLNIQINKKITNARSIDDILNVCSINLDKLNEVNISTALHRIAKTMSSSEHKTEHLTENQRKSLDLVTEKAIELMQRFDSQALANTAWAFATLNIRDEKLFNAIGQESVDKIESFNSQNLANIAWAFATLNIKDEKLFKAIGQESVKKIKSFNSQALANLAWAFATVNIRDEKLFNVIGQESVNKIENSNSQALANLAWAFATLNIKNKTLFDAIAKESLKKIEGFSSQNLANMAWAFASLNIRNKELFDAIAQESVKKIESFNSRELANIAWSFATLNMRDEKLFNAIAQESVKKIQYFKIQELTNMAWSFAALNMRNEELLNVIAKEFVKKIESSSSQNLANIAWALAVLNIREDKLIQQIISQIPDLNCFNDIEKSQLKYVYLHTSREMEDVDIRWPEQFLKELNSTVSKEVHSSKQHADIANHLKLLVPKFLNEYSIDVLVVDIAIPEKKVVIEVDGPSHFAYKSHIPLGRTVFKKRLLDAMNWQVSTIPYWEWEKLNGDDDKKKYLNKLLCQLDI